MAYVALVKISGDYVLTVLFLKSETRHTTGCLEYVLLHDFHRWLGRGLEQADGQWLLSGSIVTAQIPQKIGQLWFR
jgi:hypothetical protein